MATNAYVLLNIDPPRTVAVLERLRSIPGAIVREVLGPYDVVVELAKYSKHTNAYRFLMRRNVLEDSRVTDVTLRLVA